MSVVRVNKTSNYTVMSNVHLRDKNLSLVAKGLLSVSLALPDDWDYSIEGLCKYCNCGKDKMRSAMKELKENGYLQIIKTNATNGTFDYEYVFYENPQPDMEKPDMVQPDMVNPPQLNTKEQNTKELKTPIIPKKKTKNSGSLSLEDFTGQVDNRSFSESIRAKLMEWFEYKVERKSPYKTIKGLNMQLSQLENVIKKRGEGAVLARMDEAMSREWIGWNFDTIDAFDKNRPYMQNKQQLDKKPRYKEFEKKPTVEGDKSVFQELRQNLNSMK